MDILRVYQQGLGATPAAISMLSVELGSADVASVVAARDAETGRPSKPVGVKEAWPLVSHHHFNEYSLFGAGREVVDQRTLGYLLSFNGVVAADPLVVVSDLYRAGKTAQATDALREVTRQLAQVEPLLENGRLRITDARPSLRETTREQVLHTFGVDSNFRVFTNFVEAYEMTRNTTFADSSSFIGQAQELFELMGLPGRTFATSSDALSGVQRLGQSLIHLSWQLSVASTDPNLDIAPLNRWEQHMLESLIEEAFPPAIRQRNGVRRTRHFRMIGSAGIPNLDRVDLTIRDILAIRGDDTFEEFRLALQNALDAYVDEKFGDEDDRRAAFEDVMHEAAVRLRERSRSAPFASRVQGAVAQTGVQIAAAILPVEWMAQRVSVELITSPLASLVIEWLCGRRTQSPYEVAHRYCIRLARVDGLRS